MVETSWAEAPRALSSVEPEAVVLAEPCGERGRAAAMAKALAQCAERPIGLSRRSWRACATTAKLDSRMRCRSPPVLRPNALCGGSGRRSACATLHATVLRRTRTLASRGEFPPELPRSDPLDDATMLLAGRGGSYPALSVAIGERVGVIGALSIESAARALKPARHRRHGDRRWVRPAAHRGAADRAGRRCALSRPAGRGRLRPARRWSSRSPPTCPISNVSPKAPQRVVERFLPFVRLHAFGERLRRMLKSLDAKGMIDPDTGLLGHEAFWRDLNRAVDDAEKRGVGLSIARFSFDGSDRRSGLDAARLLARLMREVDFACREADNSIFAVFTETDLRAAHVVARRIASVLKNTMVAPRPRAASRPRRGGDAGHPASRPTASIRWSPAWWARLPPGKPPPICCSMASPQAPCPRPECDNGALRRTKRRFFVMSIDRRQPRVRGARSGLRRGVPVVLYRQAPAGNRRLRSRRRLPSASSGGRTSSIPGFPAKASSA